MTNMDIPISEEKDRVATSAEIQNWLIKAIADELKIDPSAIKIDMHFDECGLDSVEAVAISGALSDWLGRELPVTLLFEYPTIRVLSTHLAQLVAK